MKINEILRISTQHFPKERLKGILSKSSPRGQLETYQINYAEDGDDRVLILTDDANIVAYAGFISRMNGRVWQAKNLQVYPPYLGNKLGGKLYLYIKTQMKKSIQSDIEHSPESEKLWIKTIPSLGMNPKIFDNDTEYIIDHSNPGAFNAALTKMYTNDETDLEKYRYTWILEMSDHYNENSILKENSLLMPYTNIWYNFKEERNIK